MRENETVTDLEVAVKTPVSSTMYAVLVVALGFLLSRKVVISQPDNVQVVSCVE